MNLENLEAPLFVDFNLVKQGMDPIEGDEWFDNKVDSDSEMSPGRGRAVVLNREGEVIDKLPTNVATVTDEKPSNISSMIARAEEMWRSNTTNIKRQPSGRSAALKATESIHTMMKPNYNSGRATSTTKLAANMASGSTTLKQKSIKSTEQLELEKIEKLKHQAQKNKALSRKSFKKAFAHKRTTGPIKAVKPPTEPVGFHFKTDERIKTKDTPTTSGSSELQFPMNLRSSSRPDYIPGDPSERKTPTPKEPTKVQPFQFRTDERLRSKRDSSQERYVSRAEFTEKFEKKTPPRFRTKPQKQDSNDNKEYSTRVTLGKSPNLQSRHRSRGVNVIGFEEKEEMELEEIRKHKFKAQPFNPDIFKSSGELGLRHPNSLNHRPTTTPMSPQLATKERLGVKGVHSEIESEDHEEDKEFKAQTIPKNLFSKITGVPTNRKRELTDPQSPNITKRKRHESDETNETPVDTYTIKPLPMPAFTNIFQPTLPKTSTVVEPFSFDNKYPTKDDIINQLVTKKVEEENERRQFHANPMPEPATPVLPPRPHIMPTKAEPFDLETKKRGQDYVAKFNEKVTAENEEHSRAKEFKASENKSLYVKPFLPQKSTKPLTEANSVKLHTEVRTEQRSKFEALLKEKEEERNIEEAKRQALREAEEAHDVKLLRRSLVHKAQPIHQYSSIQIQPSNKQVTCPKSPVLMSLTRTRTVPKD